MSFEKELEQLINKHCKENDSDTPDFILAEFLSVCLVAWNAGVCAREEWYGRECGRKFLKQTTIKQKRR